MATQTASFAHRLRCAFLPLFCLTGAATLTGCGVGAISTAVPEQSLTIHGEVHGGQSPVSGSTIALYRVGATGLGSAATNLLSQTVTSDANGGFTLTGLYRCTNASDQVYIAATGGNPGLSGNQNNASLAMVAALGNCGDLNANTSIQINELTTMAAAYALAQFATGVSHVGASATNSVGIQNAMANAQLLANTSTGTLPTLPSTQTVETGKLLALADVIATCVNSNGGTPCSTLYSYLNPVNGAAPADTFQAALSIALNPTAKVAQLFDLVGPQSPFPTSLTAAPNDWTVTMTVTGGGLASPTGLGIDATGNVWVADYYGAVSAFTPQAVALSSSGYSPAGWLSEVYSLAIDANGDVWMTNEESPQHRSSSSVPYSKGTLVKFNGVPSGLPGTPVNWYFDDTVDYPESVTTDSNGWVVMASYRKSVFSIYKTDGTAVGTGLGSGSSIAAPQSVHMDPNHGVWLANSSNLLGPHFSVSTASSPATATLIAAPTCCSGANGVAVDQGGNGWFSNYMNSTVSEVSATGTVVLNSINGGKNSNGVAQISSPGGIFVDGAQNVWVPNYHGNGTVNSGVVEIAGNNSTAAAGTPLTPYQLGMDVNVVEPFAALGDASGNLWVTSHGNDSLVVFFGLAAPTKTPVYGAPQQP